MINASAGIKLCCQSAVKGPLMYNKASVKWTLRQSLQGQLRSTLVGFPMSPNGRSPQKCHELGLDAEATPLLCQLL